MLRRFYILFCLVFLVACDDGDILSIDLDFAGELLRCENNIESYLLYDTREDPNESLILIVDRDADNELFFTQPTTTVLSIDGANTRFIFRSYNRAIVNDELCNTVPAGDLTVTEDYEASSGTVNITATVVDDDGDGIPSADEYGPGGLADPQDWDLDGIPDYKDEDDDNDNIKTSVEISSINDDNLDGDDDPLTNPTDTDDDGTPNYLDDDDDDDGVLTRLEDASLNKNPRAQANVVVDTFGMNTYRYLYNYVDININANEPFEDSGFILNYYTRTVTTSFIIENADLEVINSTYIDLGTFEISYLINSVSEVD